MSDTTSYKATLAQLERDLTHARGVEARAHEVTEALERAVQGLRGVLGNDTPAPSVLPLFAAHRASSATNSKLRSGAKTREVAMFVLGHAERPLKIREIYNRAIEAGWEAAPADYETFRGTIAPMFARGGEFEKVEKGLYRLTESSKGDGQ